MIPVTSKPTRALILVMMALVFISLLFAFLHYRGENQSVDPRIVPARKLYENYNSLTAKNDFKGVILLLDSIDYIYRKYPHYHTSFETGVLENNRAAVYLTLVISYDSISSPFHHLGIDSLLTLGESAVRNSIYIYESWLRIFSEMEESQIREQIRESFVMGLNDSTPEEIEEYLDNRIEEIQTAMEETPRRLSVSYTNLGIIHRYRKDYQNAAACYKKALDLWQENLTAENNLNLLLGRPFRKRNFIEKMFPKPKD